MKIALIVHDLHEHGGHSLYTKVLADHFSQHHEVAVFSNRCDRPNDAGWDSQHVRAFRLSAFSTVHTFPLGMRAQAQALSKFDIRHSQGYCGGDPNVVTAHICVAAYLQSLKDASVRHRASLRTMASAEASFYRKYRGRVIAVSQKVAAELGKFYSWNGHAEIIPHGVDWKKFNEVEPDRRPTCREELGIRAGEPVALYVGDLTKAHSYLKELAAALPEIQFVIITASRAYHWQGANVQILPATPNLAPYYEAADAFVFPTTYDSFGMVVLEAMASGLPVFCSDQAGVAELIKNGINGFVTPLSEWTSETAELLRNLPRLAEIGRAARRSAEKRNWASVVKKVEQVYMEVAGT